MSKALSLDLCERAMTRLAAGASVRQVAAALSVVPSSVVKWSQGHVRRGGGICEMAWCHDQAALVEILRMGSGSAASMRSKASTIM